MSRSLVYLSLATILASVVPLRAAQAAPHGVGVSASLLAYGAANGNCVYVNTTLQQWNDSANMQGAAWVTPTCGTTRMVQQPAGHIAIRWTLWKWDGSKAVVCQQAHSWKYNTNEFNDAVGISPSNTNGILTYACGDGWYNLAIEAQAWLDSGWHGGTVFSGWIDLDVNDQPTTPD